jgi:hypothetical protein
MAVTLNVDISMCRPFFLLQYTLNLLVRALSIHPMTGSHRMNVRAKKV